VQQPVAVRYAWGNRPDHANLFNQTGLPASPFRTDDWPLCERVREPFCANPN
jgi:sialate O-acetylesterase